MVARYCRRFVEQAMVPDDADNETESRDLVKKTKQEKGSKDNDSDKPTNAPATQAPEETGETEKGQQGKLGDVMNALQWLVDGTSCWWMATARQPVGKLPKMRSEFIWMARSRLNEVCEDQSSKANEFKGDMSKFE